MTPDNEIPKITYLPKLPPPHEVRLSEGALVATPTGTEAEFHVFTWRGGRWFYEYTVRRAGTALVALLNSAYVYLGKARNQLQQAGAGLEDEALLLKLEKITKDVARARHELAFDVIVPLGKARDEKELFFRGDGA